MSHTPIRTLVAIGLAALLGTGAATAQSTLTAML